MDFARKVAKPQSFLFAKLKFKLYTLTLCTFEPLSL